MQTTQSSTQGRTAHTKPEITESYIGDNGEVMHILSNGREQSDTSYMAMWGQPKGVVNQKGKGINPNRKVLR